MNKNIVDLDGRHYRRSILVLLLISGAFCIVVNQTLLITAYPTIMKDLSIPVSTVQWLTTSFLLISGIMIPLSRFFMMRIKSNHLYLIALVLFLFGEIICFVSSSFHFLLLGRCLQGMASGVMMPFVQTIVLTIYEKNERGAAMGMVGLVIALAPAIGPTLSGYILSFTTYKVLFLIPIPIILLDLVIGYFYFRNILPLQKVKLDIPSAFLSVIGFGALLLGITYTSSLGWTSRETLFYLIGGLLLVIIFIIRQQHIQNPLLDFSVFKYPIFPNGVLLTALSYMALLGFESILPEYIQNILGETPFHSGLMLLPGAIIMGIMNPITGKIFDRFGARLIVPLGLVILAIGTFPFIFVNTNSSVTLLVSFYALRLFGISMTLMPITTASMNVLPTEKISNGTAINNTFRQIASSLGTAILVAVLSAETKDKMKLPHETVKAATISGYQKAFMAAFALCIIAIIAAIFFSNSQKKEAAKEKAAQNLN